MTTERRIYLDHNATSPLRPEVKEVMLNHMSDAGNPNSIHGSGRKVRQALDQARESVASLVGAAVSEVIFTSGGTESNHLAWKAFQKQDKKILTSSIEHSCVLSAARLAKKNGAEVKYIKTASSGEYVWEDIDSTFDFISLQHANNETGVVHSFEPVEKQGTVFHTDSVQTAGKLNMKFSDSLFDMMTLSGHKFGAPQGVGALIVRKGTAFESLWSGGPQESGRRPGTENVLGIIGLGAACDILKSCMKEEILRIEELRNQFERTLVARIPDCQITGKNQQRLPNTTHITFEGVDGQSLLIAADLEGIDCSTGSACTSGAIEPSHVLTAMGYSKNRAMGSIRFSLGWNTKEEDLAKVIEIFPRLVEQVRGKTKNEAL